MFFKKSIWLNYFLHIINGVIPLLIIYLFIKNYETEFLGKYFYYLSIISIINLFIDFGFNISALKEMTEQKNTFKGMFQINSFISSIFFSKILLSFAAFLILFIIGLFGFVSFNDISFTKTISIAIIYSIFNFTWIFYFLNESQLFSFLLFLLRLTSILFIIFFKISIFESIIITFYPIIASNIIVLFLVAKKNDISFRIFYFNSFIGVLDRFKSGYKYFLNTLLISFAGSFWPILFSKYTTFSQIAVFGVMDKYTKGLVSFVSPLPNFLLAKSNPLQSLILFIKQYRLLFTLVLSFILLLPFLFIFLPSNLLLYFLNAEIIKEREILDIYSFHFILSIINTLCVTVIIFQKKENVYSLLFIISYLFWIIIGVANPAYMIFMPILIDATFMCMVIFYIIKSRYVNISNHRIL